MDVRRIAERAARSYAPMIVAAFGSYAAVRAHEESDLGLFVVNATPDSPHVRRKHSGRGFFGATHPIDGHVLTPEDFIEETGAEFSFAWVPASWAKILFKRAGSEKISACIERRLASAKEREERSC